MLFFVAYILITLSHEQLKEYPINHDNLSHAHSGFRKGHRRIISASKVFILTLDTKKCFPDLCIYLSEDLGTVDHVFLKQKLICVRLTEKLAGWFWNYLSNRTCLKAKGIGYVFLVSSKVDQFWFHYYSPNILILWIKEYWILISIFMQITLWNIPSNPHFCRHSISSNNPLTFFSKLCAFPNEL